MLSDSSFCRSGHPFFTPRSIRLTEQNKRYQFFITRKVKSGSNAFDDTSLHWHDFVQVWYTVNGSYGQHFLGRSYLMEKGSLLLVPPFYTHEPFPVGNNPVELICCDFSIEFLNEILSDPYEKNAFLKPNISPEFDFPFLRFDAENTWLAEMLFSEIYFDYVKDPQKCIILQKQKIVQLLRFIVNKSSNSVDTIRSDFIQKYWEPIQHAIDYIDTHYYERLYIEDICKLAYMSQSHFCYIFKQLTGNTFTEYVSLVRLLNAASILTLTDKPILEIAEENGFNNKIHFYQQFKYYMGHTPKEHRELTR